MIAAFRADASAAIGSGHVMRSLCLADALRERGIGTALLSRGLPQALRATAQARGHAIVDLPALGAARPARPESPWPDTLQAQDAAQCMRVMADVFGGERLGWLVVDHYGLGGAWETAMRAGAARILAIDDLARTHDCDILLDQNAHDDPQLRYADTAAAGATCLLGPSHALLRPEFAQWRAKARARDGEVRNILVFLGGMDGRNATGSALRALRRVRPAGCDVHVVIGAAHPARAGIEAMAGATPWLHCHVQTDRMAQLCLQADLAVGAGGSATWERCALGLPTVALSLADNQDELLHGAARQGLVYAVPRDAGTAALARHLAAAIANPALRNHLSRRGLEAVDGLGVQRVIAHMLAAELALRPATPADAVLLHAWRNHPRVRAVSRDTREIALDTHRAWLEGVLSDPARPLLIGEVAGKPTGSVRFDIDAGRAEVSIAMAPEPHARGLGLALLLAGHAWLRSQHPTVRHVDAEVLGDNRASHRLFAAAGYARISSRYQHDL